MRLLRTTLCIVLLASICMTSDAAVLGLPFATEGTQGRAKLTFNADWRLCVGDYPKAKNGADTNNELRIVEIEFIRK